MLDPLTQNPACAGLLNRNSGAASREAVDSLAQTRGWAVLGDLPNLANRIDPSQSSQLTGLGDQGDGTLSFDASIAAFDAFGASNGRLSAWARGSYAYVRDDGGASDIDSDVGQLQFGVDIRPSRDTAIGLMVHGDLIARDDDGATSADGWGFMAGPYIAHELRPNLFVEGLAMFGATYNTLEAATGAEADYQAKRLAASLRLSGDYTAGAWTLRPGARFAYYAEKHEDFTDGLGNAIESDTSTLGQFRLGGEVGYDLQAGAGVIRPFVGADGVYSFASDRRGAIGSSDGADGLSATVSGGVEAQLGGASVRARASYDGLGDSDFEAIRGTAEIRLPF